MEAVDLNVLKTKQQAMWASGDFAVIGTTLQIVGESLCEAVELPAGSRVIDVACGNGNAALAAARRFAKVTGIDYVPELVKRAAGRAAAESLEVDFLEADAEKLPFGDGVFDVALSTYGVMFAPDQPRAAREMVRVVAPGGKIAMANWTPEGFIGGLLKTVAKYVPPPAGVDSPLLWGSEARLAKLFPDVKAIRVSRKEFVFRYLSAAHFVDVFRSFYGPTFKAFNALKPEDQEKLAADIRELCTRHNRGARTLAVPSEYLEVIIER